MCMVYAWYVVCMHLSHGDLGFRFVKLMGEFSVMVAQSASNLGADF